VEMAFFKFSSVASGSSYSIWSNVWRSPLLHVRKKIISRAVFRLTTRDLVSSYGNKQHQHPLMNTKLLEKIKIYKQCTTISFFCYKLENYIMRRK
jgi:hypothetical protein